MRRIFLIIIMLLLLAGCVAEETLPYRIDVDLNMQVVTVYDTDDEIVRQMICSSGTPNTEDATPCGTFEVRQHYPDEREEWYYIKQYDVYVQYVTRFNGPYLFHSLPFMNKDIETIDTEAERMLGYPVSHGCIRLRSADSRWLALNCADGTQVNVFEGDATDEALRSALMEASYYAPEWDNYEQYRAAKSGKGLIGALEQARTKAHE